MLFQHKLSSPVSLRPPSPGQPRSPADWRCRSIRLGGHPRLPPLRPSRPSGRPAPGSRSPSRRRCCRSATTRSDWRCSTARSRSPGLSFAGATRAGGSRSSPAPRSPPPGCSRSSPSRSREREVHVRRAAHVLAGVAVAGLAAGLREVELPFAGGAAPTLALDGAESAVAVAQALGTAIPTGLGLAAAGLAAVAAALPHARTPWRLAAVGVALLAATLLLVPAAPAAPLVLSAWLTVAVLALKSGR